MLILIESVSVLSKFTVYEDSNSEMVSRLICAYMLHMSLLNEFKKGLNGMKYSLTHHYRFVHWQIAYLCSVMQSVVVIGVESLCMIIVITSETPINTVFNFVALTVIVDFDNYSFESI